MRTIALIVALAVTASVVAAAPGNKEKGAKFLKELAALPHIYKLPSGMLFKVLAKGSGKSPTIVSPCDVHYKGTLIDGSKFDSSFDRGAPATFAPNQVIGGWTEALQLMREGDHWEVYIPYNLAYGEGGQGEKIPDHSTLVFEMQLIKVKDAGKPGADADAAIKKKIGKAYADLASGSSSSRAPQ
jgi:FKBP-type peptidyl-prolyl cis-trans isomerase FklB